MIILPFGGMILSVMLLLFAIIWIFDMDWKDKWQRAKRNAIYFLPVLLFVLYVIGALYSKDHAEGWGNVGRKTGLIGFPVLFLTMRKPEKFGLKHLLSAFVLGCVLVMLACTAIAIYHFYHERYQVSVGEVHDTYINTDFFFASKLSYFIHPSYEAMFIVFAQFILVRGAFRTPMITRKVAGILLILLFAVFVLFLASRAGLISLIILFLGTIVFYIMRSRRYMAGLLVFGFLFIGLFVAYKKSAIISSRIDAGIHALIATEVDKTSSESSAVRRLIWNVSSGIIRDNWLTGVGTGDVNRTLQENYLKNGMEGAFAHKLNAHDQYLQTFIAIGIAGFLALAGMIMLPLFFGGNRTDAIMVVFVSLFAFNILVESMLETHTGVFFFAFFYSVIPMLGKREEEAG